MASTTQLAAPAAAATTASPLILWHLLSLDAPTVAALWTWFIARAAGIVLPAASIAAMFLAVWILYAADRLLDSRPLDARTTDTRLRQRSFAPLPEPLEARHYFHHRHRNAFVLGIAAAGLALTTLIPRLPPAALRLYLLEGVLLAAWFFVLHATPFARRLPKELVVGLFFAAAVFIPTVARRPGLRLALLPGLALLAAIACLNCLFIHAWEHTPLAPAPALTRMLARHIASLGLATAVIAIVFAWTGQASLALIPCACAIAAFLLFTLHRSRELLHKTTLRAAADLALLTPLLLLPFLP